MSIVKSIKSNAGDGKPALIPSEIKGIGSSISVNAEKIVSTEEECSLSDGILIEFIQRYEKSVIV